MYAHRGQITLEFEILILISTSFEVVYSVTHSKLMRNTAQRGRGKCDLYKVEIIRS